jgi:hypothetical protein
MGERRGVYRVLVGKPEGKRPPGRPRHRWEDNIKMDPTTPHKAYHNSIYEGNSTSKLQIQVATYVFELSAGNCHR